MELATYTQSLHLWCVALHTFVEDFIYSCVQFVEEETADRWLISLANFRGQSPDVGLGGLVQRTLHEAQIGPLVSLTAFDTKDQDYFCLARHPRLPRSFQCERSKPRVLIWVRSTDCMQGKVLRSAANIALYHHCWLKSCSYRPCTVACTQANDLQDQKPPGRPGLKGQYRH